MAENSKKNMLLVDDEAAIGIIIQIQFDKDYEITILKNGMDAVKWLLAGNLPDLIILDLNMPEMNGLEFLKEVRKYSYFKKIPMIVLSGEDSSSKRIEAFRSGANDYLTKPFNPVELRVRMERFLTQE
jgi:DNA-binding response OmpR family regulator